MDIVGYRHVARHLVPRVPRDETLAESYGHDPRREEGLVTSGSIGTLGLAKLTHVRSTSKLLKR